MTETISPIYAMAGQLSNALHVRGESTTSLTGCRLIQALRR